MSVDQFEEAKEANQKRTNKRKLAESWRYGYLGSSLQKIESRVLIDKGAVMIVHVLSGWLASSYPIRSVFLQHISWNTIIKREFLPFRMKEWLNWCMDACSSYKYGSNIGLERLIKKYFCQHHYITIIIKGESETCPISEIAIIILSLKFIGSDEADAFSCTNLFFPPSRVSLLSLPLLPSPVPTAWSR